MATLLVIGSVLIAGYCLDSSKKQINNSSQENFDQNVSCEINEYPFDTYKPNEDVIVTDLNNQSNPIEADNKPKNYLEDTSGRPEDFIHNNMVPFFSGSSAKQDMRGTGVSSGNWNSDDYNLGNGKLTGNYKTLATFTGIDNTYMHKREIGPLFSPGESRDRSQIPKDDPSNIRPKLDRYTTSILHKNEMKPFESIKVGPGLNIGAELANDGSGFQPERNVRIMPPNVGSYNLTQLPGRIAGTKYQASDLPTALPGSGEASNENNVYGVPKLRPETYYSIEQREPMPTVGGNGNGNEKEMIRSPYMPRSNEGKKLNLYSFGNLEQK